MMKRLPAAPGAAVAGLSLLVLLGQPSPTALTPASSGGFRTGCDATRPAVAYVPGERTVSPQPSRAPVPCLYVVPDRTSESATVAVTGTGRILYAPFIGNTNPAPLDDGGPALVMASDDSGTTWKALPSGGSTHWTQAPPFMDRDPATGRVWFVSTLPDLCGAEISWTGDDGGTWADDPAVGCPGMGSERVLEGPAPAGGAMPSGYAHVVYYCANLSDLSPSDLWCYKSLDGGRSFAFTGGFPDPPPKPGCTTEHPARPGVVGTDGDLYFPVYQCGDLSVAVSSDEGASWHLVPVAHGIDVEYLYISSMTADQAGNLYLAWLQGTNPTPSAEGIRGSGTPVLSVSADHGQHWSAPEPIAPPGMGPGRLLALTAWEPGHVAVSVLASGTDPGELDGWLLATSGALERRALWWGATVNDPATPLMSAATYAGQGFGDRLFNMTDTFAPDSTPWAAFHCAYASACPGERIGIVGELSSTSRGRGP